MYPTLLRLHWADGSWSLPTYSAALTTGLIAFCLVGWWGARRQGVGAGPGVCYVLTVAGAFLLGARLAYGLLAPNETGQPWQEVLLLDFGHFYLPGGLLAAVATGWAVSRLLGLNAWQMADRMTPAVALAMAIVRLGCYGAGCCFGKETAVPWAVGFPPGSPTHLYQIQYNVQAIFTSPSPVHPTQLYLATAALGVLGAVLVLRRYLHRPGLIALGAAILWLSLRIWIDCYRADIGPFQAHRDQLLSAAGIVACLLLLWGRLTLTGVPVGKDVPSLGPPNQ
ncbi:MAG: prolipoprotein diacylglyceryl transferase [Thermoguttaceae bacterium]|nr:prolipoprotein diacylglyceryl transferase [Thermoguttaceae bacterium]MDW8039208.1 prolipoprotein diacylglyceryl transferase [Thermoguttaceae bacterium]